MNKREREKFKKYVFALSRSVEKLGNGYLTLIASWKYFPLYREENILFYTGPLGT